MYRGFPVPTDRQKLTSDSDSADQNTEYEIIIITRTRAVQHKCLPLLACINPKKNDTNSKNNSEI